MVQSITNHWTTRYLQEAIKLDDYGKHGALANNFTETLPVPEADDVKSMLKDPYIFDMLTFTEQYNERDVEIGLVKHVEKFLVEMGAGFAFMGRQYHIEVSGGDYYIDILMYKCKALRMRATGVYWSKGLSPNSENNAAVCNYGTPSIPGKRTLFIPVI